MELLIQAAIGFVAGMFGGLLGVGGSIIIIPSLILYLSQTGRYEGTQQHLLQAAAMICNVFVVAPSVLAHWRARAIMKPVVTLLIPSALVGILLGVFTSDTSLFARENGVYLAMVLSGFMVYVAAYNTWRLFKKVDLEKGSDADEKQSPAAVGAVGLVMGFMGGLLGVGGGAICVPMQQILLRVPLRRAIANSAVTIMFVSSIGAAVKNLRLPSLHGVPVTDSLQLALMLIPTAILGGYLGGKLTHALPRNVLRLVFIAVMVTMAYLPFTRAWGALAAH
ncbi:MAG: sulfite exporter TauE/SafE family protein [Planctomycetota bacterium]